MLHNNVDIKYNIIFKNLKYFLNNIKYLKKQKKKIIKYIFN